MLFPVRGVMNTHPGLGRVYASAFMCVCMTRLDRFGTLAGYRAAEFPGAGGNARRFPRR